VKGLSLSDSDRRFTRFLLGGLPEDERRRIELEFLENDDAFADLVALEDELRFAYLEGGLDPDERARFETRYLATAEDRAKLDFARALLDRAAEERVPDTPPATAVLAWWRRPVFQLALAAATLALAVSSAWLFAESRRMQRDIASMRAEIARMAPPEETLRLRDELARERARREELERLAARPEPAIPPVPPSHPLLALVLTPGLTRSTGTGVPRVALGDITDALRLELTLPAGASSPTYAVTVLDADGRQVSAARNLRASRSIVVTTVPRKSLSGADYEVVLHGIDATGRSEALASYYFSVQSR